MGTQGDDSMANDLTRIASWLQPQDILLGVDSRDRLQALEAIAASIARVHRLEPAPILRALWRREQAGSTGLGEGFAIPHARIPGIARPLTLFVRTKLGIAFDALDGKPVSQLLAIMVPADGAKEDHLQLLALVARLFSDRRFRTQLDRVTDVTAVAEAFRTGIAQLSSVTDWEATARIEPAAQR